MPKKYPLWVAAAVNYYHIAKSESRDESLKEKGFLPLRYEYLQKMAKWGMTELSNSDGTEESYIQSVLNAISSNNESTENGIFVGPQESEESDSICEYEYEYRLTDNFDIKKYPVIEAAYKDYLNFLQLQSNRPKTKQSGLSKITLGNFKGIKDKIEIPLKPITMLFGGNSAGKSTILHSLLYLRELLANGNCNPGQLFDGAVDLGDARNLVNQHNLNNEISLRLEYNFDDDGLDGVYTSHPNEEPLESLWIELKIHFPFDLTGSDNICKGQIKSYKIGFNGEYWCLLDIDNDVSKAEINSQHHFIIDALHSYGLDDIDLMQEELLNMLVEKDSVIPSDNAFDKVEEYGDFLNKTVVMPKKMLLEELNKHLYIGPIRETPEREYDCPHNHDPNRWASGLAAWDYYVRGQRPHLDDQKWFNYLRLGYDIGCKSVKEIGDDSFIWRLFDIAREGDGDNTEINCLFQEYSDLAGKNKIHIIDQKNGAEVQIRDIGTGVSQVVPVVAGALSPDSRIFSIEQPELHLHPAIQCRIADLFIDRANKRANSISLIETHSEHLILRLLRRIRETAENELPPKEKEFHLTPDQIGVFYIEAAQDGTKITELPITNEGYFENDWPGGFFEERFKELYGENE